MTQEQSTNSFILVSKLVLDEAKALQSFLLSQGLDARLTLEDQDCGKGSCGTRMSLWVRAEDVETFLQLKAAYYPSEGAIDKLHSPQNCLYDPNQEESTCPACGTVFSTKLAECPDCHLVFSS
jgi:hypothetical protein